MDKQVQQAAYVSPKVTDFGQVSLVTAQQGMTYLTDVDFTGSMPYAGMSGPMGMA